MRERANRKKTKHKSFVALVSVAITTIPAWRGSQHQHEAGLLDEGPVGKRAQSQQPLKQQGFLFSYID